MFGRRETSTRVQEGSIYKYVHDGSNCTELAEVVAIRDDQFGIPHVNFRMSYLIAERAEEQGPRTLSLSAFARHFCQMDDMPGRPVARPAVAAAPRKLLLAEGVAA
jgi:hypothetical protein